MIRLTDLSSIRAAQVCFDQQQPLWSPLYSIYYLYEGSVELHTGNAKVLALPGDCFFIPPYSAFKTMAFAPARALMASFSAAFFIETLFKIPGIHFPFLIPGRPLCREIADTLLAMAQEGNKNNTLFLSSQLLKIIGLIGATTDGSVPGITMPPEIRDYLAVAEDAKALSGAASQIAAGIAAPENSHTRAVKASRRDRRVLEVFSYMKENCTLNISLTEAAAELEVTPQYLSTLIKNSFGETYHSLMTKLKSALALQYLNYTPLSKEKIARLTGFGRPVQMEAALAACALPLPAPPEVWEAALPSPAPSKVSRRAGGEPPELSGLAKTTLPQPAPPKLSGLALPEPAAPKLSAPSGAVGPDSPGSTQAAADFGSQHTIASSRRLTVDVSQKQQHLTPVWRRLINLGGCQNFKDENFCRQLIHAQERFHFTYGRIRDIFKDTVFSALDLCHRNNIAPLIELGDCTAGDLARLPALLKACTLRYGLDYLHQWRFEVSIGSRTSAAYIEFFKNVYAIVKHLFPHIPVGGPGLELSEDLERLDKILAILEKEHMLPDFATTHQTVIPSGALHVSREFAVTGQKVLRCLKKYRLHKQLWLTQYGLLSGQFSTANDSDAAGHFICHMLMSGLPLEAMGYGALSDISEENRGDPGSIFTGEGGLITWNGLFKSGYYVLDFFRQLCPCLLHRSKHTLITSGEERNVVLLTFSADEGRLEEITLTHMEPGMYVVKQMSINRRDGNIYEHWKRFGSPKEPSRQELEMMEFMAHPKCSVFTVRIDQDGSLTLPLSLLPWEIQLFLIERIVTDHGKP